MPFSEKHNSGESSFQETKTCKLITSLVINLVILRCLQETRVQIYTIHTSGFTAPLRRGNAVRQEPLREARI